MIGEFQLKRIPAFRYTMLFRSPVTRSVRESVPNWLSL